MDACVDPLVLQLEDDDVRVRLATLEKLRKVAAVENVHFPVRNPRRFLQCLRRRALDDNAEVAREARRLVVDVMPALGDDAEQILTSILPHLIPHLAIPVPLQASGDADGEASGSLMDEEVYRVFRKYVAVNNDLKSVTELLVNIGLAHGRASVREVSLAAIARLLDERFLHKRKPGASSVTSITASRMDKALFVSLLQATVPTLEDSDEGVVVAAEETIAKLQLYWGHAFHNEAVQFLSSEDNHTLGLHQHHISQLLTATQTAQESSSPMSTRRSMSRPPSSSTSSQSRLPLSTKSSASFLDHAGINDRNLPVRSSDNEDLLFGFVPSDLLDTLASSRSNSNADWKKRTVAVEQLYQLAQQAEPRSLSEHVDKMDALFAALARLMQDVDAHVVKRALQITQTLLARLLENTSSASSSASGVVTVMLRLLHSLVETAASFADDKDVRMMVYGVILQFFTSKCAQVAQFQHALLASSLQSRRLQVREEALKVWTLLLLSSQDRIGNAFERVDMDARRQSVSLSEEPLTDETSIQVLGKLLGDASLRVRDMALETAVVLGSVTHVDVYSLLETHVDDQYVAERIDWASLRRRLRQKHVPQLSQVLPMLSELSQHAAVDKSLPGSSELQTMMLLANQTLKETLSPVNRGAPTRSGNAASSDTDVSCHEGTDSPGSRGSLSDRSFFDANAMSPRADGGSKSARPGNGYGSNTSSEEMADKLSTLKKKANQMRRTTSVKRVVGEPSFSTERYDVGERLEANGTKTQRASPARSKTSPERLAHPLSHPIDLSDAVISGHSPRSDASTGSGVGGATRRQRTAAAETKIVPIGREYYQELSPQKQQDLQTRAVNHEDQPIRSRFLEWQADEPTVAPLIGEDRPIRPSAAVSAMDLGPSKVDEYPSPTDNNEYDEDTSSKRKPRAAPGMSLATRKRLEAKHRQEELERQRMEQEAVQVADTVAKSSSSARIPSEYDGEGADTGSTHPATVRPISLATRKRLESKAKHSGSDALPSSTLPLVTEKEDDSDNGAVAHATKATRGTAKKTASQDKRSDDSKPRGSAFGSQEPRYLEPHELTPVANPKQEAATLVSKISCPDDWVTNFEALTTVRRLAAHSPGFLEDKIHAVVAAILAQVVNLRSTVSKNALLALDSMSAAFGRSMDGEVDAVVPLLLKRCGDSNQFVCESATVSLTSIAGHCSPLRVVSALNAHLSSRAVPIRREVARCMLTLLSITAEREGQSQQSAAFTSILTIVGKCLEDSNNEVRDAAKQALLFLLTDQRMDVARIKKMLPAGAAHTKLDQLVASKASFIATVSRPSKPTPTASAPSTVAASNMPSGSRASGSSTSTSGNASAAAPRPGPPSGKQATLDVETFERMLTRLDSSNWKDRFDALEDVSTLVSSSAAALISSGRVMPLFDVLVKRLDDGNAKVSALALERLGGAFILQLGDGLAPVLGLLLPALSKQLAANNARMASLALDALQSLGAHVDARLLCQHLAPLARLGNARVKPVLVDMLAQLAATSNDKLQPALARCVPWSNALKLPFVFDTHNSCV